MEVVGSERGSGGDAEDVSDVLELGRAASARTSIARSFNADERMMAVEDLMGMTEGRWRSRTKWNSDQGSRLTDL